MNRAMIYLLAVTALFISSWQNSWASSEGVEGSNNEQIVVEFIEAWSRLDADELTAYFAEDGTYYNMPIAPVTGHANLREFIHNFLQSWQKTDWEILNVVSRGNLVIAERMDRTVVNGRKVELPCVGVFEMENGKIKVWRDYFDLATFTKGAEQAEGAP